MRGTGLVVSNTRISVTRVRFVIWSIFVTLSTIIALSAFQPRPNYSFSPTWGSWNVTRSWAISLPRCWKTWLWGNVMISIMAAIVVQTPRPAGPSFWWTIVRKLPSTARLGYGMMARLLPHCYQFLTIDSDEADLCYGPSNVPWLLLDISWNEILVFIKFYPLYSIQLTIIALIFTLQSEPQKAYLDISKTHKHW